METPVEYNAGNKKRRKIHVLEENDNLMLVRHFVGDRQEAIERIAKGIHYYEWSWNKKSIPIWSELNEDIQNDYKRQAEFALNALLGE